jgi:hypothetical protein
MKLLDKEVPDQHEHNHTIKELRQTVADARMDETYVTVERQRAIAHGPIAGTNGHNGNGGALGNGSSPGIH